MDLIKRQHGFTFIELCIVMAILSVLSAISFTYFNDVFARGRDAAAISDAVSLITVVNNNFLDKRSVNYNTFSPDGRKIGIEDVDGNPIPAVFTLSAGVKIKFIGAGQISPSDESTLGKFDAFIYHSEGTPDPSNLSGADVFRRCIEVTIDELTSTQVHNLW